MQYFSYLLSDFNFVSDLLETEILMLVLSDRTPRNRKDFSYNFSQRRSVHSYILLGITVKQIYCISVDLKI